MNEQDLLNLTIKLVGTSIPGYLSYYILTRSNLINVTKNRAEENKIFLVILSAINVFIGLLALEHFNSENGVGTTFCIIGVMIIISVFPVPFLIPYISKVVTGFINFLREKNNVPVIENESRYKQAFNHRGVVRVAIFDFSRNYIASGVLSKAPLNNEIDYFDIILDYQIDEKENPKQCKFVKLFNDREKAGDGEYCLYVDFEKKVNIHIFKENQSSST